MEKEDILEWVRTLPDTDKFVVLAAGDNGISCVGSGASPEYKDIITTFYNVFKET